MNWIRKEYWKNHSGILDLENLQSRSDFIFCSSGSWRWLSSVIDVLKMGKTVKKKSSKHLWPWISDFQGQGCLRGFFYYFFHINFQFYVGNISDYTFGKFTTHLYFKPSDYFRRIFLQCIIILLSIYIPLQNPYFNLAVKKLWSKKTNKMKNL